MSRVHLCRRNLLARDRGAVDPEPMLNMPCPVVWLPNAGAAPAPETCEQHLRSRLNTTKQSNILTIPAERRIRIYEANQESEKMKKLHYQKTNS